METNIETSTNTFFLKEYEFSSLKNIHILPGVNNLCRIYDAVLEEKSEDNSLKCCKNDKILQLIC